MLKSLAIQAIRMQKRTRVFATRIVRLTLQKVKFLIKCVKFNVNCRGDNYYRLFEAKNVIFQT